MGALGNASNILTVASSVYQVLGLANNFIQAIVHDEINSPEDFFNLLLGGGTDAATEELNQKLDGILASVNALSDQLSTLGTELQQQIDAQTGLIINLDVVQLIASINSDRAQLSSYDPYAGPGEPGYVAPEDQAAYFRGFTERSDLYLQQLVEIGNLIITPTAGYTPNIDIVLAIANAVANATEFRLQVAGRFEREEMAADRLTSGLDRAAGFFEAVSDFLPANLTTQATFEQRLYELEDGNPLVFPVEHDGRIDDAIILYTYFDIDIAVNMNGESIHLSTFQDPIASLQSSTPPDLQLANFSGRWFAAYVDSSLFINVDSVPQFALPPILYTGIYDLNDTFYQSLAKVALQQVSYYDLLASIGISYDDTGAEANAYSTFAESLRELTNGIEDTSPDANGNIEGTDGRDLLKGDNGDNHINGLGDNDTLRGRGGHDTLNGGDGDDIIYGDGGDDVLDGGTGSNLMDGGDGNDHLTADGSSHMSGGAGNDVMEGGAGRYIMFGGADNDTLRGGFEDDALSGDEGDDLIEGGGGRDMMSGGDGNDILYGGAGSDTMFGDAGNDVLYGGNGGNVLHGGDGNDRLVAGAGVNRMYGGAGNDRIEGAEGRSFGVFDIAVFSGQQSQYSFRVTLAKIIVEGPDGRDTLTNVESLEFDDGRVEVKHSSYVPLFDIWGATGGGAFDILIGADADDHLDGGGGDDIILGGNGNDMIEGDGVLSVLDGADWLDGGLGNDSIAGGGGNDSIFGRKGNDTLRGEGDDDRLSGAAGSDRLIGGAGNDRLLGGDGRDILNGGGGDDLLTGGSGNDVFTFKDGFGKDRIFDFALSGNKEVIDLSDVTAIVDFAGLMADHAFQKGQSVIIDDLAGNMIRLDNVALVDLSQNDFIF
ncbi:MAG: hypothetical protein KDK75_15820 [Alphaproteobacteria bacterium]|nr:hypothetical protein [Alphaproteobacteria bacterium]